MYDDGSAAQECVSPRTKSLFEAHSSRHPRRRRRCLWRWWRGGGMVGIGVGVGIWETRCGGGCGAWQEAAPRSGCRASRDCVHVCEYLRGFVVCRCVTKCVCVHACACAKDRVYPVCINVCACVYVRMFPLVWIMPLSSLLFHKKPSSSSSSSSSSSFQNCS